MARKEIFMKDVWLVHWYNNTCYLRRIINFFFFSHIKFVIYMDRCDKEGQVNMRNSAPPYNYLTLTDEDWYGFCVLF